MKLRLFSVLLSALALCGCKHYEVRLVHPTQYSQVIKKNTVLLTNAPVEYSLWTERQKLVLCISNPTDHAIELMPEKSYVIDPWDQEDPIRGQMIHPGSFIIMRLPPEKDSAVWSPYTPFRRQRADLRVIRADPDYSNYDWPFYSTPAPQDVIRSPYSWNWKTGRVYLHLAFKTGKQVFEHDLTFERGTPGELRE